MEEQDKLRNTLREFYDTQQTPIKDGEWERASAYLINTRRKIAIRRTVVVFTIMLSALSIALLMPSKSNDNAKLRDLVQENTNLKSVKVLQSQNFPSQIIKGQLIKVDSPIVKANDYLTNVEMGTRSLNNPHTDVSLSTNKTSRIVKEEKLELRSDDAIQKNELSEVSFLETEPKLVPLAEPIMANNFKNELNDFTVERPKGIMKKEETNASIFENPLQDGNKVDAEATRPASVILQIQMDNQLAITEPKKETAATDSLRPMLHHEDLKVWFTDSINQGPIPSSISILQNALKDTLPQTIFADRMALEGIFYEVGAAWLYGWKGAEKRDARCFSPVAGINYMNKLNNSSAFSFGVQYLRVTNLTSSSKTSRISSYTYGEQSRVTVITPTTLHYLLIPLRFNYYVDRQNIFGGGIHLAYLMNADATVTTYDEKPGSKGNYQTIKQGGYTEGFSWFDSQLAFFYRRKITGSLAFQMEIFLGLVDVKQDKFFDHVYHERNSGAKLSLIYNTCRKKSK